MSDLIEVLSCGSHLFPCFIEQLNADTEELLPRSVMSKEHGVVVVAAFVSCTKKNIYNFLMNIEKNLNEERFPPSS